MIQLSSVQTNLNLIYGMEQFEEHFDFSQPFSENTLHSPANRNVKDNKEIWSTSCVSI